MRRALTQTLAVLSVSLVGCQACSDYTDYGPPVITSAPVAGAPYGGYAGGQVYPAPSTSVPSQVPGTPPMQGGYPAAIQPSPAGSGSRGGSGSY